MKSALAVCLLLAVTPLAQAGPQEHASVCLRARLNGYVNAGESFGQPLGNRLVLYLNPLKEDDWGWQVSISPIGSGDDWASPVNPPLRFGNSEYLATGYGQSVKQVLSYSHEIRFPITNADYLRMLQLAYDALWPDSSKQNPEKAARAYLAALDALVHGTVILSPVDFDKTGPPEKVQWMKFDGVVIVPPGFQGDSGLHWTTGSCSPDEPQGKKIPPIN